MKLFKKLFNRERQTFEKELPLIVSSLFQTIKFKKLSDDATAPTKAYETDSGFDLYTAENVVIEKGKSKLIKTDIAIALPSGYGAQIRPRSGVTSKTPIRVQIGTIDNTYRGNLMIAVDNIAQAGEDRFGLKTIRIKKGFKLAQLVIERIPQFELLEVEELEEGERGENGFGSTGV